VIKEVENSMEIFTEKITGSGDLRKVKDND
jgi:hypothetical protein